MQAEIAMGVSMHSRRHGFEPVKAVAAIAYLVEKTGRSLYPLMKMMYLADRLHLWQYGRLIAGDHYAAMKEGPVPSITYDMLKHVRGETQDVPGGDLAFATFAYGPGHSITLKCTPDYSELSDSDIECLDEVIKLLKRFGDNAVVDMSHDHAWTLSRKGVRSFMKSCSMSIEAIAAQREDGDLLVAHLRDPQPGAATLVTPE